MIGHLLKIIRAQFQSNLWLLLELLVVFVALWVMADYFIAQYVLYHQPVGFKTDRVYQATIALRSTDSPNFVAYPEGSEEPQRNFDRIVDQIRQYPDVEAVALAAYSLPYTTSNSSWGLSHDSLKIWNVRLYEVSRDYFRVFGIHTWYPYVDGWLARPAWAVAQYLGRDYLIGLGGAVFRTD